MSWEDFIISVTWKKKLKFNSGKENSKIDDVVKKKNFSNSLRSR